MFKKTKFGPKETSKILRKDGSILFKLNQPLEEFPEKITEKLVYWANKRPHKTFIARRNNFNEWENFSYLESLQRVKAIAQYLLNQNFSKDETIVILSENSIEHAFLALAALYIGIPYTPISPAYSLISKDFGKLKHCLELMTPKLVFAQNALRYSKALEFTKHLFPDVHVLTAENSNGVDLSEILETKPTSEVEAAHTKVNGEVIAKILFTSGSTGHPKGVINTQKMWCANLQQITQVFPFMKEEPPVFIDWLPWNHTFGGNHNFGLTLYNGGTLYLDEGKPTPKGIEITVQNLREISPTAYFNVPKGFEMFLPYLESESELKKKFFKNLNILFYAGASLAQPVWNRLEELALESIGEKIPIITGLGCTESGPSAMFASWGGSFSGLLGVPVAGMEVKLVPDGDKMEARYKAPNVTPGYWRNEEETAKAFDEEGFYRSGDAVKFFDENDPNKGLVFDGRIAEDFKLSSGTWVNVGVLKAKIISAGSPIVQDVVIAGLDKEYIGAILFLNGDACRSLIGKELDDKEAFLHEEIYRFLGKMLEKFNANSTGSSTRIERIIIATDPPSIDLGEITDKGSLNQRAVLKHRAHLVEELFK
jgi:feruloyl-CoA synthase